MVSARIVCTLLLILPIVGATAGMIQGAPLEGGVVPYLFVQMEKSAGQHEILLDTPLATFCESLLQERGVAICNAATAPLISRDLLTYTLVENSGLAGKETKTGRLQLELGSDGAAKVIAEQGIPSVSTLEIHSIQWMMDREKIMDLAKRTTCRYVLLVTATAEDQTAGVTAPARSLSPDQTSSDDTTSVLSHQRSVRTHLSLSLVYVPTQSVVRSFSDELPVMDSNARRAATRGWQTLLRVALQEWFK